MKNWTSAEWLSVLASVGVLFGTLVTGIVKILGAVKEIHLSINSRLDQLVSAQKLASFSEGREAGRSEFIVPSDSIDTE